MDQTIAPTPITVDFRGEIAPSHSWILGISGRNLSDRVDLLARESRVVDGQTTARLRPTGSQPTALLAECSCPEFCERDHSNE